jgi:hypothetical protein
MNSNELKVKRDYFYRGTNRGKNKNKKNKQIINSIGAKILPLTML